MSNDTNTATVSITDTDFDEEVLNSKIPVLVDFWAEWCGPCKVIGPTLEEIATEYLGRAKIAKINVDDSPDIARKFGIRSIPTLILFNNGEVVDTAVGLRPKKQLGEMIEAHIPVH